MIGSRKFFGLSFFMPMDTFIVFKKQKGEIVNAYSLVNETIVKTIPKKTILGTKKVTPRLYSTDELNTMRDEIVKEAGV